MISQIKFNNKWMIFLIIIEMFVISAYFYLFWFHGALHVDEGGYVYASNQIANYARIPYHDFLYLQNPGFAYFLAIPFLIFKANFFVARGFMVLFGLATVFLSMVLAKRLSGPLAVILVGFCFAITPFQIEFFSIARMYSLTAFFLCTGMIFETSREENVLLKSLSMVSFVLAAGTRLTFVPVPFIYIIYLIYTHNYRNKIVLIPIITSLLAFSLIFLPFAIPDFSRFYYNILGFHLDITVGGFLHSIFHKIAGMSRMIKAYFFVFLFLVISISTFYYWAKHPLHYKRIDKRKRNVFLFISLITIIEGGIHFTAKFFQESYQAPLFPYLAIIITILFVPVIEQLKNNKTINKFLSLILSFIIFSSVLAHGKSGLVFKSKLKNIYYAQSIADYLSNHTSSKSIIITANSPLIPLLANRKIMQGFESIEYFPLWSEKRAKHLRVVNHEMLKKDISNRIADAIIIDTQSFSLQMPKRIASPFGYQKELITLLDKYYPIKKKFQDVFTSGQQITIYLKAIKQAD